MASSNTDAARPGSGDSSCFANLPFELVVLVITAAAHDCVRSSTRWVASLMLVCRAIYHAVDPILVETLRITDTNCDAVARHKTRFQRTRHFSVIHKTRDPRDDATPRCFNALLQQRFPSLTAVSCLSRSFSSRSMLRMLQDSHARNFITISHLHIRHFSLFLDTHADWLPSSVTYLVLDPVISEPVGLNICVHSLSRYLEEQRRGIKRLLIRTPFVSVEVKREFADAVTAVALARRDTRLCMDDERKFTSDDESVSGKAATMDERTWVSLSGTLVVSSTYVRDAGLRSSKITRMKRQLYLGRRSETAESVATSDSELCRTVNEGCEKAHSYDSPEVCGVIRNL